MIDILSHGRRRALMPRSLILEPTRELAAQVAENFDKYGKNHDLKMALLIGGVQMGDQVKALNEGVDVLIATPGRLMDLFERGKILLTGCDLLVIDEADRMLDMGFIPDIEFICTKLPANRQTLLFSATMPPPITKLADKFLTNPKTIEVARPATANINIAQYKVPVSSRGKRDALTRAADDRQRHQRADLRQPQDHRARAQQEPASAPAFRPARSMATWTSRRASAELRAVQGRRAQHPRRERRCRARARHQGCEPRVQLRHAVASRRLYPPHWPHRPRGRHRAARSRW